MRVKRLRGNVVFAAPSLVPPLSSFPTVPFPGTARRAASVPSALSKSINGCIEAA